MLDKHGIYYRTPPLNPKINLVYFGEIKRTGLTGFGAAINAIKKITGLKKLTKTHKNGHICYAGYELVNSSF